MNLASYSTGRQRVAILPLVLVVAFHLILLLLWLTDAHTPVESNLGQRSMNVTFVPALRPRVEPLPAPVRTVKAPTRVARPVSAPVPRPLELALPGSPPSIPEEALQQRTTAPSAGPPDAIEVNQVLDAARRLAGSVDRELRNGKPAPVTPDRHLPIARLRSALESAYIDGSRTMVTESTVQSDGVVVYRFRQAGKVWCRQSGGGRPSALEYSEGAKLAGAGSAGGGRVAGTVSCPSGDAVWSRL